MPFGKVFPGKRERRPSPDDFVAAEDASRLAGEAVAALEAAVESDWYRQHGGEADRATLTLCRLRRARAGERGGPTQGDEAVREALRGASPEAVYWIASRAISYMDENGFPETVEPWFDVPAS